MLEMPVFVNSRYCNVKYKSIIHKMVISLKSGGKYNLNLMQTKSITPKYEQ